MKKIIEEEYKRFDVDENIYSQSTVDSNGVANNFHELWQKQPDAADKTKLDGLWKRVFEISYINGIAVDTVSVPDDAILDVNKNYVPHNKSWSYGTRYRIRSKSSDKQTQMDTFFKLIHL